MRLFVSGDGNGALGDASVAGNKKMDRVDDGGESGDGEITEQASSQCCGLVTHPSSLVCPRWRNYDGEEKETLVDKDECSLTWQDRVADD